MIQHWFRCHQQVITWAHDGNKPLPEPMMTPIYVAIWHYQATMSKVIGHYHRYRITSTYMYLRGQWVKLAINVREWTVIGSVREKWFSDMISLAYSHWDLKISVWLDYDHLCVCVYWPELTHASGIDSSRNGSHLCKTGLDFPSLCFIVCIYCGLTNDRKFMCIYVSLELYFFMPPQLGAEGIMFLARSVHLSVYCRCFPLLVHPGLRFPGGRCSRKAV